MLDTALGQRRRIEQAIEFLVGQVCHFARDVLDRPAFVVGFLGDRRALLVADDRIQRGDQDRIAVERTIDIVDIDRESGDRFVGKADAGRAPGSRCSATGCARPPAA